MNDLLVREYKNGNITLKYNCNTENIDIMDCIVDIINTVDWIDTYDISGLTYYGNDCMAMTLYNIRLDKTYLLNTWIIATKLLKGYTIRLYARTPDASDKELIDNFYKEV